MEMANEFPMCGANMNWLTAHNWQKWKSTFPTYPCHDIYREEAVDVKSYHCTFKKYDFVNLWIWGNFLEIWYFVNNCLIKIRISKFFCIYVTHEIVITCRTSYFVST